MTRFTILLAATACMATPCLAGPATAPAATPAPAPAGCPTFSVATNATDKAIFVDVTPAIEVAEYNWTIGSGTISSGQGTASIMIDTDGVPEPVQVEVHLDVTKIPNCPKGVSLSGIVKRT